MAEEAKVSVPELEKAEIPWVVAYLREDIQDLRNEVREVRRITIKSYEKLDAKMDAKFEALRREMDVRFRWTVGIVIGAMLTMMSVFAWIVDRMLAP